MERDECYSSGNGPRALSVSKGLKSQSVSPHSLLPRKPHAPFLHGGPIPQCMCVCVYAFIVRIYNCMGILCQGGPQAFDFGNGICVRVPERGLILAAAYAHIYTLYIFIPPPGHRYRFTHFAHPQPPFLLLPPQNCHPSIQLRSPLNGSESSLRKTTMPLICILLGDSTVCVYVCVHWNRTQ